MQIQRWFEMGCEFSGLGKSKGFMEEVAFKLDLEK